MKEEIVRAYLKHNGYTLDKGDITDNKILLPFLLMDLVLSIYRHDILPVKMRFEMNHWKKEWRKWYNKFNQPFFRAFNREQTDVVIKYMEELESIMQEDLDLFRKELRNLIKGYCDDSNLDICINCLTCNVITHTARLFWGMVYRQNGVETDHECLIRIQRITYNMTQKCYKEESDLDISKFPEVENIMNSLCDKIVKWTLGKNNE